MISSDSNSDVIFDVTACPNDKKIAIVTLNKPKSLNALTINMVDSMQKHLNDWQSDKNIVAIIIKASGDKAFCAGGDIQSMYLSMIQRAKSRNDGRSLAESFFEQEYRLNYSLITCPIPIIMFGHGIIMGGGLGIFNGGTFRIVTEKSRLAMPEICIGLYPDVGASNFLNKLPNNIGRFLALTGSSVNATDSVYLGLANTFVQSHLLMTLQSKLCEQTYSSDAEENTAIISSIIDTFEEKSNTKKSISLIKKHEKFIQENFSENDIHALLDTFSTLETQDEWLTRAQGNIKYGSPLSALIIDEQLKRSKNLGLKQVFESELVLSCNITHFSEFAEGVRALIVDKDFKPNWHYKDHRQIPKQIVNDFFVPPWNTNPLFSS